MLKALIPQVMDFGRQQIIKFKKGGEDGGWNPHDELNVF